MAAPLPSRHEVRRWLALTLATAAGVILVVLLGRIAAGASLRPPGLPLILCLTAAAFAMTLGAWGLEDAGPRCRGMRRRVAEGAVATLAAILIGLLVAGESPAGLAWVSALALISSGLVAMRVGGAVHWPIPLPNLGASANGPAAVLSNSAAAARDVPARWTSNPCEAEPAPIVDDPSVRLRIERRATDEGETIEVQARLRFEHGQREAALHLPLWPPLEADPQVECEPLESADVELRITAAARYGIRLEARLDSPADARRSILIGVEIRAPLPEKAVADAA